MYLQDGRADLLARFCLPACYRMQLPLASSHCVRFPYIAEAGRRPATKRDRWLAAASNGPEGAYYYV